MKLKKQSLSIKTIVPIILLITLSAVVITFGIEQTVRKHWVSYSLDVIDCDKSISNHLLDLKKDDAKRIAYEQLLGESDSGKNLYAKI